MLFSRCSYNICETSTYKAVGRRARPEGPRDVNCESGRGTRRVGGVQAATAAQSRTRIAARPYAIESVVRNGREPKRRLGSASGSQSVRCSPDCSRYR